MDEYWNVPRFIDGSTSERTEGVGIPETEAITEWEPLQRSYENQKWYLVVFKPYNKPYEKDPQWFEYKAVDKATKWCKTKCSAYFVTREKDSTKVHGNAVCVSSINLHEKYHEKTAYNKYKIYVTELPNLGDRIRALNYITKESNTRSYKLYLDYYMTK